MSDAQDENSQHHPFDPPAQAPNGGDLREGAAPQLALDEDERLPWLESADDDDDDEGAIDTGRVLRFLGFGLALLLAIGGGLWFVNHRGPSGPQVAEGGVINAPAELHTQVPPRSGDLADAGTGGGARVLFEGQTLQPRLGG